MRGFGEQLDILVQSHGDLLASFPDLGDRELKEMGLPQNLWVKKLGLCPRPQDFQGMARVSNGGRGKKHPWQVGPPGGDAPLAHPRAEYPLSGCVPAEPDSVSSATLEFSEKRGEKVASCPIFRKPVFINETGLTETGQDASTNYPQSSATASVFCLQKGQAGREA
jgi:hypothetical protein